MATTPKQPTKKIENVQANTECLIATYHNVQYCKLAISNVIEKVKDSKLKKELKNQYHQYDAISERAEDLARYFEIDITDNGFIKKAKAWLNVNMATMMDKSNRKIASINIFGSVMGVIDLICVLSDYEDANAQITHLARELKDLEEQNSENLKVFLLPENNKPKNKADEIKKQQARSKRNARKK